MNIAARKVANKPYMYWCK